MQLGPHPGLGPLGKPPVGHGPGRPERRGGHLPPRAPGGRRGHDRGRHPTVTVPTPTTALGPRWRLRYHPLEQFPQLIRHQPLNNPRCPAPRLVGPCIDVTTRIPDRTNVPFRRSGRGRRWPPWKTHLSWRREWPVHSSTGSILTAAGSSRVPLRAQIRPSALLPETSCLLRWFSRCGLHRQLRPFVPFSRYVSCPLVVRQVDEGAAETPQAVPL